MTSPHLYIECSPRRSKLTFPQSPNAGLAALQHPVTTPALPAGLTAWGLCILTECCECQIPGLNKWLQAALGWTRGWQPSASCGPESSWVGAAIQQALHTWCPVRPHSSFSLSPSPCSTLEVVTESPRRWIHEASCLSLPITQLPGHGTQQSINTGVCHRRRGSFGCEKATRHLQ